MIEIIKADITTLDVDAIVNAANSGLRGGGGVDGAIHRAAGPELMYALEKFPACATADAVITRGFRLPAKFVIHAVGPIWRGGNDNERELLRNTYESSFARARETGVIKTIAFPAISTGIYGFPKRDAAQIALLAMHAHQMEFARIIACLYDDESAKLYRTLLGMTAV